MRDLTVIISLYKTPENQLQNLSSYKNLKTLVLDQCPEKDIKVRLSNIIGKNLKYYKINKNLGLSKSANFLLSKVKTKYFLFTQADIKIKRKSIKLLKNFLNKKKDFIFVGPRILEKDKKKKNKIKKNYFKVVKKLNAALLLIDTKKIKKIGFFDNDFFLYWEDIYLMNKIQKSKYKMAYIDNIHAFHKGENSSIKNYKIDFIRWSNYRFGEYLYDYKSNKFKWIKIIRRFLLNILCILINLIIFRYNKLNKNLADLTGIFKFIKFYLTH